MFGAKKGSGTPCGKLNSDLGAQKGSFFLDFLYVLLNSHILRHSECSRGVQGLRCDLSKFTKRYTCAGFSAYSSVTGCFNRASEGIIYSYVFVVFSWFFNILLNVWFQQVPNMLRLCMFQRFPRMLAVWGRFCDFMYFWLVFHILWNIWFEQVHQTLRICRFLRFFTRMWTWTFGLPGAPWGHSLEAIFTKRYACACLRVFGNQRKSGCINSPGLSFRLSKD